MADDLKPMLAKVLASGGRKKFFFAYASGKRKDGKGDGELAIGGTKPKKADIEGELADCKEVLEGVCWTGTGANDGGTVYFQGKGKKLATTVIAKMMLTAKRVTGRQCDFQVPSPEEEARAANLKEEDDNEAETAKSIPPPPPLKGAQELESRLKALLVRQKALLDKDPSQKEKLLPLYQQAWALMKSGKPGASEALDKFEATLNGVSSAPPQAPPKSGDKPLSGSLESMTYQRVLADLKPRYDQARVINAELVRQMEKIEALAKANRFADALEVLDQLEIDVDRTLASALKPVTGDEFKARLKALLPKYNAAIKEDPALLAKLKPVMGQVIALGNANQFDQALPFLIQIEKALDVAQPGDKTQAPGMQRLNGLMPAIKAALSAGGPNVARIQTLVSAAGGLLKNKDMVQANKVLDELEPLLKPAEEEDTADLSAKWKAKLAEWTPAIKAAMAAKGPNAAAIAKLLAQATALSKPGGDMAQALAKLTDCHALATPPDGRTSQKGSTTPQVPKGLVEKRKFLLTRWKQIPAEIAPERDALLKSIAAARPDITNLDELGTVIDRELQALYDELQNEIDTSINKGDSTILKGLRERVLKHEFVTHLMSNPFVSGSKFQTTILNALQEVEQHLAS